MRAVLRMTLLLVALVGGASLVTLASEGNPSPYTSWKQGPSPDPAFFPIGVWLQNPARAPAYRDAGINFYLGLWQGPTEEQLATLKRHGMRVIAGQNDVGLRHRDDPIIMGWMHNDEPDNAQPRPEGGYGPPVKPSVIVAGYKEMAAADPARPVLLNLGQGVANDEWVGRGPGARLTDYIEYCKGADIVSFDVYPVAGINKPDGENYLWYVAKGLDRLRQWCGEEKLLWNIIETTNISSDRRVTPHHLRAEVWMSLIHGSRGIVYFVHRFKPSFVEATLLQDAEMLAAVTAVNREIQALAPVLNSTSLAGAATVTSSEPEVPIDWMVKRHGGATYVFAIAMRNAPAMGVVTLPGVRTATLEVLGENRTVDAVDGSFTDRFEPYAVHIYVVRGGPAGSG